MSTSGTIVIITPGFPKDEADTSCIPLLQDFVLGWKEYSPKTEIRIIAVHYPYEKKHYYWNGLPVFCAGGGHPFFRKLMAWGRCWKELLTLRRQGKSFVILSWMLTDATLVGSWFARFFHFKHFAIAAGQDVLKSNSYLKWISLKQTKVIVLNEKMNNSLIETTGKSADFIIPIGIDTMKWKIANSYESIRPIDILVVGSLIKIKQVEMALKMISLLKKDFPDVKTEIIGDGPERKNLEAISKSLNLANMNFTGEWKREQVIARMLHSKILLHTSAYEGQSTVITEALACGMTVVCFDVGRIDDHPKMYVCRSEDQMKQVLLNLLKENKFDFSSVVPHSMEQTIHKFSEIIFPQEY